ncbi:MAG: hypothetical protein WA705_17240 [Candidatus Ozemobacteraceae bacterium]
MKARLHPLFRFLSIFLALTCSSLLTGCGSGGGNAPAAPGGPGSSELASIEGYVSQTSVAASLRLNIGSSLARPLAETPVDLIAFDAQGGEHVIAETITNERGYYLISQISNLYGSRNLILRARPTGTPLEAVLPLLKNGITVRAQTIDPDSGLNAIIVRRAARQGKQASINLGEIRALLPGKTLQSLNNQSKLDATIDDFIARDDTRSKKLGGIATTLMSYAFELQQTLLERIELGELTAEEAWKTFNCKLVARARELGITAETLQSLDNLDQALIFEPVAATLQDAPGYADEFGKLEAERLRERKLRLFDAVAAAVSVLTKGKPEFAGFFTLVDSLKKRLEQAGTISDIHRLIKDAGTELLSFTEYLSRALLEVKFTPELVAEVFRIQVPMYGFEYAGRLEGTSISSSGGTSPATPPVKSTMVNPTITSTTPVDRANELVIQQESMVAQLVKAVREAAGKAAVILSEEQANAVAWLIWARSPENLNFPPPAAPPVDPGKPDEQPSEFSLSGRVTPLATSKLVEGYTFTHALEASPQEIIRTTSSGEPLSGATLPSQPLAWLSAKGSVETIKVTADGGKTITSMTLDELSAIEHVEIYGFPATSPTFITDPYEDYKPMPMPTVDSPDGKGVPVPVVFSGTDVSTGEGEGGSSPGNIGSGGVINGGITPSPLYIVVTRAIILPPMPPAPQAYRAVEGKVIQPQTNGVAVPGLFLFETADPGSACNGSILRPAVLDYENTGFIKLSEWVGKKARMSGTLIIGVNQTNEFLVEIIETAL